MTNGAVAGAQACAQYPDALHVLHGCCLRLRQGAGDGKVQTCIGGKGAGVAGIDRADVDVADAALQVVELQIERGLILENRFAIGRAHILAPGEQGALRDAAILQNNGLRGDGNVLDCEPHICAGIPGNGLDGGFTIRTHEKIIPLQSSGIGVNPTSLDHRGN